MNDAPPPMPPRPQYLPGFGPPQSLPPGFLPDHAPTRPPAPTRPRRSVGGVVLFLAVGLGTGLLVLAGIGVATYPAVRRARHQAQHVNSVNAAVDKAVAAVERAIADARDDLVRLSGDERLLDPTTIHSQRELDRRVARFESTVQSLREARRGADAARQQLRQDLAALGVAPDVRDQWLARCDQQSEWPIVSDAFDACEKFAVRARDLLRYLRNTWGVWRVNDQRFEFTDRQILNRYNELVFAVDQSRAELLNAGHRARERSAALRAARPVPAGPGSASASASASDPRPESR